ncbi:tectonic-like complex member MKS1 [Clavelina lepadiformis]|uniref:Meckel syndrome type 1 protein n=1 Tax=Clavelina lepadiformis TaxID=159417 RepID=A0ABP0FEH9_CLALP
MDKLYEKDLGGATYRSRDPIKNFTVKIKLQRLSASTIGFLGKPGSPGDENQEITSSVNQYGQTILENEELTVHWQQKFFSQREMEFYGFEPNCTSVLDYKYHAEVEHIKVGGRPNTRLFTYVDKDRFSVVEEAYVPMTTSVNEMPSHLSSRVTEVRRRKNANSSSTLQPWELNKGRSVSGMKLVEEKPTDEFTVNHHVLNTPVHVFIIMADLSPEGQLGSAEFERRLCTIEYDDNCVIRVSPDFTRSKPPYRIEEGGLSRDIWDFQVEHVSNVVSKMESRREGKVISELYRKHQTYLKGLVGESFEELPSGIFRLLAYGEILSAESFEYDDLHVEFFVDLPKNWSCDPGQLLSGCTHSSRTTLTGNTERAYFAQPFNYQLFFPLQEDQDTLDWPKIFLHVISSDTWGRRRTEGYGYFSLPTRPGCQRIVVQCWRPTGNEGYEAITSELNRFFIGGNPELEDISYAAIPNTFEGKHLSKYGVRTETGGSVTVQVNCIQQCKAFQENLSTAVSRKKLQSALQIARGQASKTAIHGVMDAYQRARKRMQLARENVPNQIRESAEKNAVEKLRGLTTQDKIKNILRKAEDEQTEAK